MKCACFELIHGGSVRGLWPAHHVFSEANWESNFVIISLFGAGLTAGFPSSLLRVVRRTDDLPE